MIITPIKTEVIRPNETSLDDFLSRYVDSLPEKTILAVTSKVISICEGRFAPIEGTDEEELAKAEADWYLPASFSQWGHHFTILHNTLLGIAGIDKSNGGGKYILWPKDPQESANYIRKYLKNKLGTKRFGVVITDSTSSPMRMGATGINIAHSGFESTNNYIDTPDLFGRPFEISKSNIAGGLAASAVLAMGEGAEQTPMAIVQDVPFVNFKDEDPDKVELESTYLDMDTDLFAPFLKCAPWEKGDHKK